MRIAQLYARGGTVFSFEFFPPKTDEGYRALYETIADLKRLDPGFVSVTCGAAGSTRQKTAELVVRIQRDLGLTAMAHVVCTGTTSEQLLESLGWMRAQGVENVLALRGDPPKNEPSWRPVPGGFRHSCSGSRSFKTVCSIACASLNTVRKASAGVIAERIDYPSTMAPHRR